MLSRIIIKTTTNKSVLCCAFRWLRFRVIAQGFTVAAAVVGGWQFAQDRKEARRASVAAGGTHNKTTASEEELKLRRELEEAERRRFEARLKEAEEAHRLEVEVNERVKNLKEEKK